jgi:transcriptional regulator with XRE-family HTH domain
MDEYDLGVRLRELRHQRRETLEQVAEATGLSVAMLSRVERGERLPSPESVEALARHFGLSAEILMSETIANRMFNRYGPESSRHAAERMRTDEPGTARSYGVFREMAIEEALGAAAASSPPLASASGRAPDRTRRPPRPHRDAWVAASVGLTAESVPSRRPEFDALADAARVAEVALMSAMSAAERAMASGDPQQIAEAERVVARLRRVLGEG